ncbi:MAG: hypothetical protein IJ317_03040 [Clostridia bacterium]|nr:hypothetical protein [Clostridia bacterium]
MFLISAIVALQHEYAHAVAAAKRGYTLDKIVLMPYGAVIDGDVTDLSLKDELAVALAGPLCNLLTAAFFIALWWLYPTVYAFTDVACYASFSVAAVNLIPAYPLDGGRILKSFLYAAKLKKGVPAREAERFATKFCKIVSYLFAAALLAAFAVLCIRGTYNFTLLLFAAFLLFGAIGNGKSDAAAYKKIDFSFPKALARGAELKRVAISHRSTLKNALPFLERGVYLVFEIYDDQERYLGELPQNEFSKLLLTENIYKTLGSCVKSP